MTPIPGPTAAEETALTAAYQTLARMGIVPGPQGYDLPTLAAAIYAHGGAYEIDMTGGSFRVEIRPEHPQHEELRAIGVGWTPAIALTFALVEALSSDARTPEANDQPFSSHI